MASKQLGKLRQWAGEVISSREKTVFTEEFKELEQDVELRRTGIERLLLASEGYHHALTKKKDNVALDDPEKLLPVDTLGIVMITHGDEFGPDSEFGTSLVKLGRAHCKIATLQEAYAVTFHDTFLASIEKFGDELKEYDHMKKKLESRRLSYDAAISKAEKSRNKKDKDKERKEAEEELERCQARYEETTEDVRAHMHAIQENEIDQMRELTAFLDLERNFVEQYLEVLKEVKSDWAVSSAVHSVLGRGPGISRSTSTKSKPPNKSPKIPPVAAPKARRLSSARAPTQNITSLESTDESGSDSDDYESAPSRTTSRNQSRSRRSSMAAGGRASPNPNATPISRPSSRASKFSRKRADSQASAPDKDKDKDKDDEKEKEKEKAPRRKSVAGWASSAMGSFSGRSKKSRDKDQFATLTDGDGGSGSPRGSLDDIDWGTPGSASGSVKKKGSLKGSLSRASAQNQGGRSTPPHPTHSHSQSFIQSQTQLRIVRALYDFDASAPDELSFRVGDDIRVISEVLDGWWQGKLVGPGASGKEGLFPTAYTEAVSSKPPIPTRPDRPDTHSPYGDWDRASEMSDLDEHVMRAPLSPAGSPFFGGKAAASHPVGKHPDADSESFMSSVLSDGDDDQHNLVSSNNKSHQQRPGHGLLASLSNISSPLPTMNRSSSSDVSSSSSSLLMNSNGNGSKKAPPPPPPPRRATATPVSTPPIPARRPSNVRSHSSHLSASSLQQPSSQHIPIPTLGHGIGSGSGSVASSSVSSHSGAGTRYDTSPFESATELELAREGRAEREKEGCTGFKQNPFKPKGMCSNCLQFH